MAEADRKTMEVLGDLSATKLDKKASGRVNTLSKYQGTIKAMQETLNEAKKATAASGAGASSAALSAQVKTELKTIREKAAQVKLFLTFSSLSTFVPNFVPCSFPPPRSLFTSLDTHISLSHVAGQVG